MSTTQPVKNPTPKMRFMSMTSPALTKHRDMVSSDQFDLSCDHAMLELVKNLVGVADGNQYTALSSFHRIQGAYEFLGIMKTLAEPTQIPTPLPQPTLDHRV